MSVLFLHILNYFLQKLEQHEIHISSNVYKGLCRNFFSLPRLLLLFHQPTCPASYNRIIQHTSCYMPSDKGPVVAGC